MEYATQLEKAHELFNQGSIKQALPLYLECLEFDSENDEIIVNLFSIYLTLGKKELALKNLEKSCSISQSTKKLDYLVSLYQELKLFERGIKFIGNLKESFYKELSLFILNKCINQNEKAAHHFYKSCYHDPNNKSLLLNILPLFTNHDNNYLDYENIYSKLIVKHSNNPIITLLTTNLYIKLNRYEQAKKIITNYIGSNKIDCQYLYPNLLYHSICSGCDDIYINKLVEKIIKSQKQNQVLSDSNIIDLPGSYYIKKSSISNTIKKLSHDPLSKIISNNIYESIPGNKGIIHKENHELYEALKQYKNLGRKINLFDTLKTNLNLLTALPKPNFFLDYTGISDQKIYKLKHYFSTLYEKNIEKSINHQSGKILIFCDRSYPLFIKHMQSTVANWSYDKTIYIFIDSTYCNKLVNPGFSNTSKIKFIYHKVDAFDNRSVYDLYKSLAAINFDLVYYFESGTTAINYFFPYLRLSPIQVVGIGTPMTTGNPNLEYSLQPSINLTSESTQKYYAEQKIHYVNGIHIENNLIVKTESEYSGLPTGNLYMCHHTHFKIHPDMDEIILEICKLDPDSKVLLGSLPYYTTLKSIEQRLTKKLGMDLYKKHIFVLPKISREQLISVLFRANVMLDTLYFGSGTTAIESIYSFLPTVTFPSLRETYVSQIVSDLYKALDNHFLIQHCIAHSIEDYVNKSVTIATDQNLRDHLSELISNNIDKLDDIASNAYKEFSDFIYTKSLG